MPRPLPTRPERIDRPAAPLMNRCAELTAELIGVLTADPDRHHRAALTVAAINTIGDAVRATMAEPETQH